MASRDKSAIKVTLTRDLGLFDITMIGVGAMIGAGIFALTGPAAGRAGPALPLALLLNVLMVGASGERLFEQRLFGSIPQRVAREATKTVIMTKRHWRLKSLLGRVTGSGA